MAQKLRLNLCYTNLSSRVMSRISWVLNRNGIYDEPPAVFGRKWRILILSFYVGRIPHTRGSCCPIIVGACAPLASHSLLNAKNASIRNNPRIVQAGRHTGPCHLDRYMETMRQVCPLGRYDVPHKIRRHDFLIGVFFWLATSQVHVPIEHEMLHFRLPRERLGWSPST